VAPVSLVEHKPIRSARKAKGDGYLRRVEILEAAERIFIAEGYEGATIRKIADEVGVSSTALYMHFRDKDQILHEICLAAMQALLEQNSLIAARPVDSVTRVRLMLEAYVRMGLEHPNAYRLVFCSAPRPGVPIQTSTTEIGSQVYARYVGVIHEIAESGRLRVPDPNWAAQALWAACHGLVTLMITRPTINWGPADELTSITVGGLLHGLVAD
jgi:AcrR family transcriptional regulator